jgi:hypothetical protein
MSEAILKFNLSDPDDYQDFKRATKANDMAFALFELLRNTRKGLEWEIAAKISDAKDKGKEFDAFDAFELIFETIYEKMEDNNINIDELI